MEMNDRVREIEEIIQSYLPKEEGYQFTVLKAMNYSVLAGGKRLRPMLMLQKPVPKKYLHQTAC